MHFQLPRVSEPGFRIKRFLHFNILRSQVAHPPLVSPEPHGFYTFGRNVHFGSWLLPASGLLRLFASRIVTLKIQGRSTSAESSTKTQVVGCPWHGWVSFGRVTSLGNGPMDSVQVGKAVFVKEDYTTLGSESWLCFPFLAPRHILKGLDMLKAGFMKPKEAWKDERYIFLKQRDYFCTLKFELLDGYSESRNCASKGNSTVSPLFHVSSQHTAVLPTQQEI